MTAYGQLCVACVTHSTGPPILSSTGTRMWYIVKWIALLQRSKLCRIHNWRVNVIKPLGRSKWVLQFDLFRPVDCNKFTIHRPLTIWTVKELW